MAIKNRSRSINALVLVALVAVIGICVTYVFRIQPEISQTARQLSLTTEQNQLAQKIVDLAQIHSQELNGDQTNQQISTALNTAIDTFLSTISPDTTTRTSTLKIHVEEFFNQHYIGATQPEVLNALKRLVEFSAGERAQYERARSADENIQTIIQLMGSISTGLSKQQSDYQSRLERQKRNAKTMGLSVFLLLIAIAGFHIFILILPPDRHVTKASRYMTEVVEGMAEGVLITDDDSMVVFSNDQVGKLVEMEPGWSPTGRSIDDLIQEAIDRGDYTQNNLEKALQKHDHAVTRRTPSGRYIGISTTARKHGGRIGFYRDITEANERELAMRKAAESDKKFGIIASNTTDVIAIMDYDFSFVWVNPAFEKTSGYSLDEVIGQNPNDIYKSPDRSIKTLGETLRKGIPFSGEMIHYKKNGTPYWAEINIQPILDDNGRVEQFISSHHDITQRINERQQLERSEKSAKRLARVIEHTSDAVIITDTEGVCVWTNQALTVSTGYQFSELIGRVVGPMLIGPKTDLEAMEAMRKACLDGKVLRKEVVIYRKDKTPFWAEIDINPLMTSDNEIDEIVIIQRDIDAKKARELELKNARIEAEAANSAKSDFLANMSHEIRTPMNGIVGMSELLQESTLTEEQSLQAKTIVESGRALLTIINDILDFSKIEAGKFKLNESRFNLFSSLSDVVSLISPTAHKKGVEIILHYPSDIDKEYIGDAGRIRQIITNVIGNAMKFTNKGFVAIRVSNENKHQFLGNLQISVEDTGVGIPKNRIEKVFSAFEQAENGSARKFEGTGLGLAISQKFAQMMGGDITADSVLDEGSTFTISLELNAAKRSSISNVTNCHKILSGKSVILVDDHDLSRKTLSEQLSELGTEPVSFTSAKDAMKALEKTETRQFDLLISDDQMPELSGIGLAEALTHSKRHQSPPILLLTSVDPEKNVAELEKIGIVERLAKPVNPVQLKSSVTRTLGIQLTPQTENGQTKSPDTAPANSAGLILIAEDNKTNQLVLKKMLEHMGYDNLTTCENGKQAIEKYNALDPDIILMDWFMPEMDGLEATREIRAQEQKTSNRHCPIIALTASAIEGDEEKCLAAGMDDYITKPIDRQKLLDCLSMHLNNAILAKSKIADAHPAKLSRVK